MAVPGPHQLGDLAPGVRSRLDEVQASREACLGACRRTIRLASMTIRAVHRLEWERAAELLDECQSTIREAQVAVADFPSVAHAGFLHDAEKEFVEAVLTGCLVRRDPLPTWEELEVGLPAWLNGLAEAASELRRHLLDRLRAGQDARAEELLAVMEDVYELLIGIDYPDAITGGLRRTADSLRAVLERTRSDVTTTLLQVRLQESIEGARRELPGLVLPATDPS
jgi:translin